MLLIRLIGRQWKDTGKTFVYTKTILEMNKRYGFTKFIIVVPSVAIREGVYKSFQVTEDYFKNQYDNRNASSLSERKR